MVACHTMNALHNIYVGAIFAGNETVSYKREAEHGLCPQEANVFNRSARQCRAYKSYKLDLE